LLTAALARAAVVRLGAERLGPRVTS